MLVKVHSELLLGFPLTDVDSNSMSMFITKPKFNKIINKAVTNSKKNINEIYKKKIKKKFKFIKIKFGEILIFSLFFYMAIQSMKQIIQEFQ